MSTRSMIMLETEKGKYKGIYCHSDGYITYNGAMLMDHYKERARVERLMSLGDMSQLNEKIEPDVNRVHSFDDRQEDVCVFYGRDRGERNTDAKEIDLKDIDAPESWIEYCYVYGLDDKWRYFVCGKLEEMGLKDLEEGLKEEYDSLGFSRPEGYYGFYTDSNIERYKMLEAQKNDQIEL